jgi:hypothetical protein
MAKSKTPKKACELTVEALRKAVEFHKEEIGKHRDALRDLLEDMESVVDASDRGIEHMEAAVDALSEYV